MVMLVQQTVKLPICRVDGSNVPYVPEHRFAVGADYDLDKFSFGLNVHIIETYGTATETETEYFGGKPNARAGRIRLYTSTLYAGYQINDNYRIKSRC